MCLRLKLTAIPAVADLLRLMAANVLSEEVREKVERQKARMASADEAPTITPKQAADLMRQLIAILQPGENVTKALKRLRPVKAKGELYNNMSIVYLEFESFGKGPKGRSQREKIFPGEYVPA